MEKAASLVITSFGKNPLLVLTVDKYKIVSWQDLCMNLHGNVLSLRDISFIEGDRTKKRKDAIL